MRNKSNHTQLLRPLAWLCLFLSLILAACTATPNASQNQITASTNSISARADVIDEVTKSLPLSASYDPQKKIIFKQTFEIKKSGTAINQAAEDMKQWGLAQQAIVQWYQGNPLVRFAVFVWYSLWTVAGTALIFCLIGFLSGFNPFGVLHKVAQWIAGLISFGQLIWIPQKIALWWKGLKVVKAVVPVTVKDNPLDPLKSSPENTPPSGQYEQA